MKKCEGCSNGRLAISENGYHVVCCLSQKKAVDCLVGKKNYFSGLNEDKDISLQQALKKLAASIPDLTKRNVDAQRQFEKDMKLFDDQFLSVSKYLEQGLLPPLFVDKEDKKGIHVHKHGWS